jgi:hypothetical protein
MCKFLGSWFSAASSAPQTTDHTLVRDEIERVLDGTDPRLRGFHNYRGRLFDSVMVAMSYVSQLLEALPRAVEISRSGYASDARLRGLFATPARMGEWLLEAPAIQAFEVCAIDYLIEPALKQVLVTREARTDFWSKGVAAT